MNSPNQPPVIQSLAVPPASRRNTVTWKLLFIAGLVLIFPFRRRLIASHALLDLLEHYQLRRTPLPVPAIIVDDGTSSGTIA